MIDRTAQIQNEPPLLTEVLADLEKDFSSRQQILRQAREKDVAFISQAISESRTSLEEISQQFSIYMQRLNNIEPDASFLTEFEIYIKDAGAMLATKLQTAERHVLSESEWDRMWHNIDLAFDSISVSNTNEKVYEIYLPDSETSYEIAKKVEIHVGEIIDQRLNEILPESRQRAKALMEQGRLDISQQVRSSREIARYNLEDIQAGLVNYSPKKLETMTESLQDGLRRAINRLDDVILEANRVWDDIKNELQYAQNQVMNEVRSDIQKASDGKAKFTRTSKFLWHIVEWVRISCIPRTVQVVTMIMGLLKRIAYLLSRLLIFPKPTQVQKAIDKCEVISAENLLKRIPALYLAQFSLEPLAKEEFLVGRQEEYKIIQEALLRWRSGNSCSILNVGEKGSGKTSLINCFQKRFFSDFETLRGTIVKKLTTETEMAHYISQLFGLPENLTFDQLVQAINAGGKRIVILEGCHNLYLRRINGFEAFRQFLSLIIQTNLRVMWVLTMDEYAWRYLARAGLQRQTQLCFDAVINVQPMKKEDIRESIVTRHNDSGYQLRYSMNDELRNKLRKQFKIWRDVTERQLQKALEDEFFDTLFSISFGNISVAIFYWLNSLRFTGNDIDPVTPYSEKSRESQEITGSNGVEVQPLKLPEFHFLSDLSVEQNFALLAIIEHENLTADELATVLDIPYSDSLYILSSLANKRLITFEENGGRYSINPIILRPIIDALINQNLVY
jgi:hypothetical protein